MHPNDIDPSALPWSPEAEAAVLGSLMLNADAWDMVGDILEPHHFFDRRHSRIFAAITRLVLASKPADVVSVWTDLEHAGEAEDMTVAFVNELAAVPYSLANARRYAEVVAERALMRGLIEASAEVREIAMEPGLAVADRLDKAQGTLQALAINRSRQVPVHVGDMAAALCDRIQDLHEGRIEPGTRTGIPSIDKRLNGGWRPGKLIILAARPAIGKSSLAMQLCINLAERGQGAAFLSQEMPTADLMDRVGCNVGRILLDNVVTGNLRDCEWPRLTDAVNRMRTLPLYLDDQPALTLADIQAKARALVRQSGIKLLVLDYIQLCGSRKTADKRHHQIEEISRGLKTLAKQLGITILALSQLGREVEKRPGGKPQLSDLKESGAIEEDADVVIFLSLSHIADMGGKVIEADFAKNRQGRVGSVALAFDGGFQSWTDSGEPLSRSGAARPRGAPVPTYDPDF
ncbi:replicative DNA helicase [Ottowia sp. VDI28]|uniref:replicative DNA helicase n=1 Tax=Ottowia sp. VDI28 TaxID=3133968 RepID=UPI003C2ACCDF